MFMGGELSVLVSHVCQHILVQYSADLLTYSEGYIMRVKQILINEYPVVLNEECFLD